MGLRPKSSPNLTAAVGETGARFEDDTLFRNDTWGRLKLTLTVEWATTSVDAYGPIWPIADSDFVFGSTMRSNENLTAWALNGVPSWKVTPWRSLKVNVLPPAALSPDVPRPDSE